MRSHTISMLRRIAAMIIVAGWVGAPLALNAGEGLVYEGREGPGKGRHIVFIAAEWEYRAEECLPMFARILAERHGFRCTVLFPINKADGTIDPNVDDNVPGLEALKTADLLVTLMMMLELPDEQMRHIADYVATGRPVIGLRCSTLAFNFKKFTTGAYQHFEQQSQTWPGGFGQQVLGETWRDHYGHHKVESTRGVLDGLNRNHPILQGVRDVWGSTDVYQINQLPADARVLMHGVTLTGMKADDPPNLNKAAMPLVWTRETPLENGRVRRVLTSTMGSGTDFQSEDLRRLVLNGCYWALGMEKLIPERMDASPVGDYHPSPFGRDLFKKGVRPADHRLTMPAASSAGQQ